MSDLVVKCLSVVSIIALAACADNDFQDLDDFMAEIKNRPAAIIQPIPVFDAYRAFTYSSAAMRSPFENSLKVTQITRLPVVSNVRPDFSRAKEYLEQFNLDTLSMVGTLQQGDTLWVLIEDAKGGVHRVSRGNYIGRNHGRIVDSTKSHVAVIEILPDGIEGWIERAKTIKLKTVEQ